MIGIVFASSWAGGVERLHTAVGEQNGKVCLTGGGICLGDQYRPQKKGVTHWVGVPGRSGYIAKGPLDRQISCQPARRHIEKFGHGIHRLCGRLDHLGEP